MGHEKPDRTLLKQLPQIEELLEHPHMRTLDEVVPHEQRADAARKTVEEVRTGILSGKIDSVDVDAIALAAAMRALDLRRPSLRPVINASGVIIHTNLGRSALAAPAVDAVTAVASGYSTLEYDTATMSRGSRHDHCEHLICALTGAEAAIAVNNNAAAVMMVLSEFATGQETVISRGELVEIGGSFRIPDIMDFSGARMVEVGTTNKTHLSDYERAITPETTMLLKVHPSNYRMIGFTESVSIEDMRALADKVNSQRSAASLPSSSTRTRVQAHLSTYRASAIMRNRPCPNPCAPDAIWSRSPAISSSADRRRESSSAHGSTSIG